MSDPTTTELLDQIEKTLLAAQTVVDERDELVAEVERLRAALKQIKRGRTVPMWARVLADEALNPDDPDDNLMPHGDSMTSETTHAIEDLHRG